MGALPLRFDEHGLIPAIAQDHLTGEIRMVAYANREAVEATLQTGKATFWSRSRQVLWQKGSTSGSAIDVSRVLVDCDADCLVYSGEPHGGSCHTGAESCFFRALEGAENPALSQPPAVPQTLLASLESLLEARKTSTGAASYTKSLYDKGPSAIAAKVREEAGELAQAVEGESDERVVSEAADTVYHLLVALRAREIPLRRVLVELARRLGTSGHAEKLARSHVAEPAAPSR